MFIFRYLGIFLLQTRLNRLLQLNKGDHISEVVMEEDQALDNVKAELPKQDSVATAVADGYICETCSKVFVNKAKLQTHRRQVHSEKRFACPHCDKVFKSKDGIKKHMPVHTGEKNYVCKHCGKAFGDPSSRNQHEKFQHPSEGNKIICKECGK